MIRRTRQRRPYVPSPAHLAHRNPPVLKCHDYSPHGLARQTEDGGLLRAQRRSPPKMHKPLNTCCLTERVFLILDGKKESEIQGESISGRKKQPNHFNL